MRHKLFTYSDYRTFLKSHSEIKKQDNPNWSLGVWANTLKLKNKSTLLMVLSGKRHPGDDLKDKLCEYFNFNKKEMEYFNDLIQLQKAKDDPKLSAALIEKIGKIHPNNTFRLLDDSEFSAICNWHYYAIREMVNLEEFIEDSEWIQGQLNFQIAKPEINKTIKELLQLKLLKRNENGKLVQSRDVVTSTAGIPSEAIKRNHEQNLDNAKAAVRKFDINERYMGGLTMTIKEANFPRAKELIRNFEDKFMELMEEDSGDTTIQLNLQMFPLTKLTDQRA